MSKHALVLVALLPALAGCAGGTKADPADTPRGLAVRTAAVVARNIDEELVLTGTLKPRAQVEVVAEVPARLLEIRKREGAKVVKGEVLAVLDDTDYRLARERARAALAVAEANAAHAAAEKKRADDLLETGGITDKDHLSAEVGLQVATASLAQARAEASIAEEQYARTRVKAPFSGRIARRHPDAGAMLAAGQPLFTLVDDSVLEFEAPVASRDFGKVRRGAAALLTIDALPGTRIEGTLVRLEPLVDERSRSFGVTVEVPGRDDLVGGLFARAAIRVGTAVDALVVPPAALVRDGTDPARAEVFVVREGRAGKVEVTIGVETPEGVQVTTGLAAGDEVVLDPPTALASGAPVEVQNAREAAVAAPGT